MPAEADEAKIVGGVRSKCIGCETSAQLHPVLKRRMGWRYVSVLRNEATGVRGYIVDRDAAGEVLWTDPVLIMGDPVNRVGHGCAEHARRSR